MKGLYLIWIIILIIAIMEITMSIFIEPSSNSYVIPGQYLVKLKAGVDTDIFLSKISEINKRVIEVYSRVFNGFTAKMDKDECLWLDSLNEVEMITADELIHAFDLVTQHNSGWNLARLSRKSSLVSSDNTVDKSWDLFNYSFDSSGGMTATVFIVDTGVNIKHLEFEGRAHRGENFVYYEEFDDFNGHGTHCAATAVGKFFGVAKKAKVVDVKVLNSTGWSTSSSLLSGIEWVAKNAGPRSVMSLSLGGSHNQLLNDAVKSCVSFGITAVIAAGNSAMDACLISPASEPLAITVAASDINDSLTSWSNRGSCIDIIAPGHKIRSAWIGSKMASETISGTSMATPQVAGLAAYFITRYALESPARVWQTINKFAFNNILKRVPSDTVNKLSQNDVTIYYDYDDENIL